MKDVLFPVRKCVGCNEMVPKNQLLRIAKSPEGEVFVDFGMKAPGRGAYVCRNRACIELAVKRKGFNRSLKTPVDTSLIEILYEHCEESDGR